MISSDWKKETVKKLSQISEAVPWIQETRKPFLSLFEKLFSTLPSLFHQQSRLPIDQVRQIDCLASIMQHKVEVTQEERENKTEKSRKWKKSSREKLSGTSRVKYTVMMNIARHSSACKL